MSVRKVGRAFAPATVANVVVGFDTLGHAVVGPGDEVEVERAPGGVVIESIEGADGLPLEPELNTAGAALLRLVDTLALDHGFRVRIRKGLPPGSGMGSSAASAVAAVVAANAVVDTPCSREMLLDAALSGEAVASGARHADNVAPALFGGLVLAFAGDDGGFRVVPIPAPPGVECVLVRPELELSTAKARAALGPDVELGLAVRQAALLGAFVAACHAGDADLIGASMRDLVVGPQRAPLVPGFDAVCAAARDAGALGCSLAGAGPSVMAWARGGDAEAVRVAMVGAFGTAGLVSQAWISPIDAPGAGLR